jgi:secreted trypsin-like serine protease
VPAHTFKIIRLAVTVATVGAVFLTGATAADAAKTQARASIVNGYQPDAAQWPWMAALLDRTRSGNDYDRHFCGGTLVNPRVVLTAAHCVHKNGVTRAASSLQVGLGKRRLSAAGGEQIDVTHVSVHPSYGSNGHRFDVALLYLARPSAMTPATLLSPTVAIPRGTSATVMGGGTLSKGGPSPDDLHAVDLSVWSDQDCRNAGYTAEQRQAHAAQYDPETMLCAGGYASSKISCYGDSGGGLMVQDNTRAWRLVGVVSFDVGGCAGFHNPDFYAWAHGPTLQQWIVAGIGQADRYASAASPATSTYSPSTSCSRATRSWRNARRGYYRAVAARNRARHPGARRKLGRLVVKRRATARRAAARLSRAC